MAFKMGSSHGGNDDGHEDLAEINIIPLVDVMLVLLIIFMVTAPLSIGGIKIELPTSKARSSAVDEDRIVLTITKGGEFFLDKTKIPNISLPERLKSIYEMRTKKEIYIRADRDVPYGRVVDAMSAAKLGGVGKISMLTQSQAQAHR